MPDIGFRRFVIVAWLSVLGSAANAACSFATHAYRDEMANPSQIEHISVEIKNSRKWFKNSLSIITSRNRSIDDKFKDKLGADLTVAYNFGSCIYPARVRQNGDWKDHIKTTRGGNVISSLDVRLKEGNILNAVRFKLLLPETREGVNEVLGTLVLNELGYIAPETFLVSADINGVHQTLLFQENAEKELLERRNRREGPIFEGDESLLWNWDGYRKFALEDISLARQTNAKWAEKGENSTQISLEAFKKLQSAYTAYSSKFKKSDNFSYTYKFENADGFFGFDLVPNVDVDQSDFENYALVLLAMNGGHALRPHNRKFYFNSFTQSFEPIYYDGDINFLNQPNVQNLLDAKKKGKFFLQFASPEVILQIADQVEVLRNDALFKRKFLDRVGTDKKSAETLFDDALTKVSERLLAYHREMIALANSGTQKSPTDMAALQRKLINQTKRHGVEAQYVHVVRKTERGSFLARIAYAGDDANPVELSPESLIEIMSKNTLEGKRMTLLPDLNTPDAEMLRSETFLAGEIVLSEGIQIDINHAERVLTILQEAPTDWVLIRGVDLFDWKVVFEGALQDRTIEEGQRFNEFGLTGCLNFYDVTFKSVNISGRNGQCEDTVNIVFSRGTLSELVVESGFADAIDIDFAKIMINRLNVARTGNDCFDVSTGTFEIKKAVLSDCGDKGISVGENSLLQAGTVDIQNAVIGVSSKDFSRVSIGQFSGDNIAICAEAFQKKQEFGGGALQIDSFQCKGEVNQDPASSIVLGELIQ